MRSEPAPQGGGDLASTGVDPLFVDIDTYAVAYDEASVDDDVADGRGAEPEQEVTGQIARVDRRGRSVIEDDTVGQTVFVVGAEQRGDEAPVAFERGDDIDGVVAVAGGEEGRLRLGA